MTPEDSNKYVIRIGCDLHLVTVFVILVLGIVLTACVTTVSTTPQAITDDICSRHDCIPIDSLPVSLEGGHCYTLQNNFTIYSSDEKFLSSESPILIENQSDIDLYYNNHQIESQILQHVLWIRNSHNIRVHQPLHYGFELARDAYVAGIHIGPHRDDPVCTLDSSGIIIYGGRMDHFYDPLFVHNSEVVVYNTTFIFPKLRGYSCHVAEVRWSFSISHS